MQFVICIQLINIFSNITIKLKEIVKKDIFLKLISPGLHNQLLTH